MTPVRARLELASELHPARWADRHAQGEVPDAWPYGLQRLAGYGVAPQLRAPLRGRLADRVGRALRHRGGGMEWLDSAAALATPNAWRAEVIVAWDERTGVPAVLRERAVGHRPVVTGVVWLADQYRVSPFALRAARSALPSAAAVWVLTAAMIGPLVREWGVPADRVRHIPFGVDTDFFRPGPAEAEPGLVVSAGNDRHRDHAQLVRAVAKARGEVPEARLELATRLPVDLPAELGAVHPGLDEAAVARLYRRAGVVALATTPNLHGSGMTVALEAMAVGRPVVVPDTPGLLEYVADGETGLTYPVGDEAALTARITELLRDPDRAAELGRAGRRRVESMFTTELQARRLADTIHAI
jgi:glycosyltransferase involved in cell wall biosynthesis